MGQIKHAINFSNGEHIANQSQFNDSNEYHLINIWYLTLHLAEMRHPNEIRTQNQWHESIIYLLPKHHKT